MESIASSSRTANPGKSASIARRRRKRWTAYWFLLPALGLYAVFFIYPFLYSLFLSFHRWNMISPVKTFVGWSNYSQLLQSEVYWTALANTVRYVVYTVPLSILLGLVLAIAIESLLRGKRFYRLVFYLPVISSIGIVSVVWDLMYNPNIGVVNELLAFVGIKGGNWLNDSHLALGALAAIGVWKHLGYNMVLYISGLKAIDRGLYEAAALDGSNRWQQFRHITVPLLSPVTFFILIVSIMSSFQAFATIQILTKGGPNNTTNVLVYQIYQEAFSFFNVGMATASSTLLLLMIGLLTIVQLRLGQRFVHYQ